MALPRAHRNSTAIRPAVAIGCAVVWAIVGALATSVALGDVVVRRDDTRIEGRVLSVDDAWVVLSTDRGRSRIPRSDVATIAFDAAAIEPALRVEIRVAHADDAMDVLLDDEPVVRGARTGESWTDVTPRLKQGNHALRFRIRNERGPWNYRVLVRINGHVEDLRCGGDGSGGAPCSCCGLTGYETGWIEDVPPVWIHVDRELGRAEILR